MFLSRLTISKADLQPGYLHLNHASILSVFEKSRAQMLVELGYPLESFITQGLLIVVTRVEVDYLREVVEGDVSVRTFGGSIAGKDMSLWQELFNHRGKRAVAARIELKLLDRGRMRAVDFPHEFAAAFVAGMVSVHGGKK